MRLAAVLTLITVFLALSLASYGAEITLVKHAKRPQAAQGKTYVVKPGDTLRRIFLDIYKARQEDLPELYRQFKEMNPSVGNLDNILVGTLIRIPPLAISGNAGPRSGAGENAKVELRELTTEEYIVRQGEYLAKILKDVSGIPDELVFTKYMDLVLRLNPSITDPDRIYAGQKLKLPSAKQVLAEARKAKAVPPPEKGETSPQTPATTNGPGAGGALAGNNAGSSQKTAQKEPLGAVKSSGEQGHGPNGGIDARKARERLLPALRQMGGVPRDRGNYFVPVESGMSLTLDTGEIPVVELDTGKKIILDLEGRITPEVRGYIEKAFPAISVVSGRPSGMEDLVDKILNVSGFFSVNKDPSPVMVGAEEKVSITGKWLVYKDFSRRNVFLVSLLGDGDPRLPRPIRSYVGSFGIDVVEIGGSQDKEPTGKAGATLRVNGSYRELLGALNIPCQVSQEIVLVNGGPVRIVYRAPILVGKVILADTMPDEEMISLLASRSYKVIDTSSFPVEEVLRSVGVAFEGPPVRFTVAKGRGTIEIPALRIGSTLVVIKKINPEIQGYVASLGMRVLLW